MWLRCPAPGCPVRPDPPARLDPARRTVIGRHLAADLRVDAPDIAPRPTVIEPGPGGGLVLLDNLSGSRTCLAGRPIVRERLLDGDRFSPSQRHHDLLELRVEVGAAPAGALLDRLQARLSC